MAIEGPALSAFSVLDSPFSIFLLCALCVFVLKIPYYTFGTRYAARSLITSGGIGRPAICSALYDDSNSPTFWLLRLTKPRPGLRLDPAIPVADQLGVGFENVAGHRGGGDGIDDLNDTRPAQSSCKHDD